MCFVNESNFSAATLLVISELLKVRKDVALEIYKFNSQLKEKERHGDQGIISIHAKKRNDQGLKAETSDSEEEENFQDVDRVLEEKKTAVKAE